MRAVRHSRSRPSSGSQVWDGGQGCSALVACGCLGDIRVIKSMCLAVRHRGWVIFILPPYNTLGIITVILSCLGLRVRLPLPALTT